MEIRAATVHDVPHVLPLVMAICRLHASRDSARFQTIARPDLQYEGWLITRASDPKSVFLVAEHEGRIVGYVVCTIEREIPIYRLKEYGWIHDLWVDETYRNEGVGRQMTMLVIERFKSMGVSQIRIQTAYANDVARTLFASCGFRVSTIDMLMELQ